MTNFLQEKSNILQDPKTPEEAFEVKLLRALEHMNMSLRTQIGPETPQAKTFKIQESKKKRTQLEKDLQIGPGSRMNIENDLNIFYDDDFEENIKVALKLKQRTIVFQTPKIGANNQHNGHFKCHMSNCIVLKQNLD